MTPVAQLLNKLGLINMCSPSNKIPGEKLFYFLSLFLSCVECEGSCWPRSLAYREKLPNHTPQHPGS
jgi:hypothetical protein